MNEKTRNAIKRIQELPLNLAKEQIAQDTRPLDVRIANDVYILTGAEPHSYMWTEAFYRLRLELRELRKVMSTPKGVFNESVYQFKTYGRVLEHRYKCPKWKRNEFCLDCFGGGLSKFWKNIVKETTGHDLRT